MIPIAHAQTYLFMLVAMVMYGLPWGAGFLIYSPVLLEMVGSDRYTSAIGYVNTLTAAGNLIAGPFGGKRNVTSWQETFSSSSSSSSSCSSSSSSCSSSCSSSSFGISSCSSRERDVAQR